MSQESSRWLEGKGRARRGVEFGRHVAYWMRHSPRRLLHFMSYYKFAAKMIGRDACVLDVGCAEGLGTWLLAVECGHAVGIDFDGAAIRVAQRNWPDTKTRFVVGDFLEAKLTAVDAVVCLDVIEHIMPVTADKFLKRLCSAVVDSGVAVVGTPNITAQCYASDIAKAGHVNCYSAERLEAAMCQHFRRVFLFGANDEVVHTGFAPMAHYLLAVGVGPLH